MLKKINPLIIIITVAFFLRIIYLYTFARGLFFNTFSDAAIYQVWAVKIITGNAPSPPFFMSPFYPYFLVLIYKIFGPSITTVLFLQVIMDTLTTYLIFKIANLIFNKKTGLAASFIYAIFPSAIFYSGLFLMPTFLTFLFTSAIYLIVLAVKKGRETLFFFAGLIFGIAALGRGNVLLPAIAPFFYFWKKKYLAGLVIPILLLFMINLLIGKSPIVTTYNLGLNFYIGNNPHANGIYQRPGGLDLSTDPDGRKSISKMLGRYIRRHESSQFWTSQALSFIKHNPLKFITLSFKKIYLFWGPLEIPQFEDFYYVINRTLLKYLPIRFWMIAPLFFISIFAIKRKYSRLMAIQALLYSVAFLPFFIIGRFRQPVMPLVIILASAYIFHLIKKIKKKRYRTLIPPIGLTLIYLVLSITSQPKVDKMILETRSDYALWVYYHNHQQAALDTTKAILLEHPYYVKGLVNLGNYFYRSRDYPVARILYEKARSIKPDDGEANANLGVTLIELGKPDSALFYLKKAKELMPFSILIDSSITTAQKMLKKTKTKD